MSNPQKYLVQISNVHVLAGVTVRSTNDFTVAVEEYNHYKQSLANLNEDYNQVVLLAMLQPETLYTPIVTAKQTVSITIDES